MECSFSTPLALALVVFYLHHWWQHFICRSGVLHNWRLHRAVSRQDWDQVIALADILVGYARARREIHGNALRSRARARMAQGQFIAALQDVSDSLELFPQDARSYYLRGVILHSMGRNNPALVALDQAFEHRNGHHRHWPWVHYYRARVRLALQLDREAWEDLQKSPPRAPQLDLLKAQALAGLGRYQDSLQAFSRAGHRTSRLALAECLLGKNHFAEALFWINQHPHEEGDPAVSEIKSLALCALGKQQEAQSCLDCALQQRLLPNLLVLRGLLFSQVESELVDRLELATELCAPPRECAVESLAPAEFSPRPLHRWN